MSRITPFLWFDSQAEDAAKFYASIFPNSKIAKIARYPEAGSEVHGRAPGSVMTVEFDSTSPPSSELTPASEVAGVPAGTRRMCHDRACL